MAGLYVFFGEKNASRIEGAGQRLRFFDEQIQIISAPGLSVAWVSHDDAMLFGPALDPVTGVRVITSGRVSWDEPDWESEEKCVDLKGGLSNRILLRRYLKRGVRALEHHNGPAALLVWDPRDQKVHLFTDQFGYHPVFFYKPNVIKETIIATFPDAIADDTCTSANLDAVSMAEFLSAWRVTPPNTYYKEIKYAGAATHSIWNLSLGTFSKRLYWQPYPSEPFDSIGTAAEELADALRHAISIRTLPRLSPIVCYTSGGMDSRTVLFAANSPTDIVGLNLYDTPNKESAVAKRLCESAGVKYEGFARDNDYYPRLLNEGVRLSGAMWSHEDNHFLGTRERVDQLNARTVVSACTTDWLFKGYGLEKRHRRLCGRNLPIMAFSPTRVDGFLPNVPRAVPREFANAVRERLRVCFEGTREHLEEESDWLAVEDRRIRPACYAVSVSGQSMYRVYPYDTFLADTGVADCYARCRAEWKLNSDLWGKTVRRICVAGKNIEDANFGWRIGASTPAKLAAFGVGWIRRRINPNRCEKDELATDGSWPNLSWYIRHSKTIEQLWESVSSDTQMTITGVWGSNPWETPLKCWSGTANDLFRILTLARYLELRKPRKL